MRTRRSVHTTIRLVVVVLALGAVAPPALASDPLPATVQQADLRADVNRDGVVDLWGSSDEAGEDRWTLSRGPVVLPNIDDDSQRCSRDESQTDRALAACNDAADTIVNGASDALDLAPLRTVPMTGLTSAARGTVRVVGGSASKTRIFVLRDGAWTKLAQSHEFVAADLKAGVRLGIEARDVVRDLDVWSGLIKVRLTVSQGGETSQDVIAMHVAPLLTHHPLQGTQQVLVTDNDNTVQHEFVTDLAEKISQSGVSAPVTTLRDEYDIWTQDYLEPAYTSMTGPDGTAHVLRVMIRSAQNRWAGRQVFTVLRGPDVGAVQMTGGQGWDTLDSFGNLETVPPYAYDDQAYPAGRIIMGQRSATKQPSAQMRTMLSSQGMQEPLLLDTSWLYVGHVDEFVQFLPADTPRGWMIGIADPQLGLDLLRSARAAGHGAAPLFSVPGSGSETIDQALADPKLIADNALATTIIEKNLTVLTGATGVTEAEVLRIPSLFSRSWPGRSGTGPAGALQNPDAVEAADALTGTVQMAAHIPGAVNGVILSPTSYLAPQQWGPVIDGVDIFGAAVEDAYARIGMQVTFLDDWYSHHVNLGEVHCGTNVLRDVTAQWWPDAG